ncbi:hypothetical protein E2562_000168 [Oryza meyeriana var. granulata]|uniref:Uncharacterized protein n=1 Tax=Oryza meyeriana var. granulata TaxID=110450 RepID=A0A6G1DAR8_9ORYZ|nr:hypothetical protein E2562_000168 [Oryza meyeriana var. granulata]
MPSPLGGVTPFGIAARCNATSSSAVSEAAGAANALPRTEPVVSAEWLHANLRDPDVKLLAEHRVVGVAGELARARCRASWKNRVMVWEQRDLV